MQEETALQVAHWEPLGFLQVDSPPLPAKRQPNDTMVNQGKLSFSHRYCNSQTNLLLILFYSTSGLKCSYFQYVCNIKYSTFASH